MRNKVEIIRKENDLKTKPYYYIGGLFKILDNVYILSSFCNGTYALVSIDSGGVWKKPECANIHEHLCDIFEWMEKFNIISKGEDGIEFLGNCSITIEQR